MRGYSNVFAFVLALAGGGVWAGGELAPLDFFPDERAAMEAMKQRDTPATRAVLAQIRYTRAGELMDAYVGARDPGKLIWAMDYASSATELDPRKAAYWFLAGYLYGKAPRNDETDRLCEAALKQAIALESGHAQARALLGMFYTSRGRHEQALGFLEAAALRLPDPLDPALLSALCQSYVFGKASRQGERFLQSLIEKRQEKDLIKIALATIWRQSGGAAKAKALLGEVAGNARGREENREAARLLLADM